MARDPRGTSLTMTLAAGLSSDVERKPAAVPSAATGFPAPGAAESRAHPRRPPFQGEVADGPGRRGRQGEGVRRLCLCRVGASEAGPASGLLQVSLSIQSSVRTGGPAHGLRQHRGAGDSRRPPPGKLHPQTSALTSSPRSLEWPHSETGSVQLETAKMRSGLRWGGPMSPLSL